MTTMTTKTVRDLYRTNNVYSLLHTVTPKIAAEMLSTSVGNRQIRQWHVRSLAQAIQRGEWKTTHQGIAFDRDGNLRDGHHRLNAIVMAGIPVALLVTTGLPVEATTAMDQGMVRTMSDLLTMDRRVAEVVKLATRIARGESRPTAPQCQAVADTGLAKAVEQVLAATGTARTFFSSAPVRLAAAVALMRGHDSSFVLGQYTALIGMEFDRMTAASQALVRQVQTGVANSSATYPTVARAMNVFDPARANLQRIVVDADTVNKHLDTIKATLGVPVPTPAPRPAPRRAFENEFLGASQAYMAAA